MEAVPPVDGFQDQEVGRARCEGDVGGGYHGPAVAVGGQQRLVDLADRGDLLALEDPAAAPQVGLQNRRRSGPQHGGEL